MSTPAATPSAEWIRALPSVEVEPGRPRSKKLGRHQIAFFRSEAGLHAVDNLCPHEGYPLVQGVVRDCVLTCAWHNFRFDLRDGSSLIGEEAVRSYPVEERDGSIWVDLTEPDPALAIPAHAESLEEALHERDFGRIARDVVRLIGAGVCAEDVALMAARFDARRGRFGAGHALPLAADLQRILPFYPGARAVLPLTHLFDVATEANAHRREKRPVDPLPPDWLSALCSEHFLMFGHCLIYNVKLFPLLETRPVDCADDLLTAHFLQIVIGIRDDTLPTWGTFRDVRSEVEPELQALYALQKRADGAVDTDELAQRIAHGTQREALDAVVAALRGAVPVARICDALALAAAERMLHFDLRHELDPAVQEGWLDVSHVQTVARAAREGLERWRDPRALRWLLQSAFYIQTRRPLDAAAPKTIQPRPASAAEVADRVRNKAPDEAVAAAAGHLAHGGDPQKLKAELIDAVVRGTTTRAIYTAHHLKNLVAAFDEGAALGPHPRADTPVLAAVRLAATADAGFAIPQAAHEALRFVVEGRKPNALT
jgi:nitrite reductase/ring-hydroxylating ferredoxin subunit